MNITLPKTLQTQIKSKPKHVKLTFFDKLELLQNWAADDEDKKKFVGFSIFENGDYNVNIPVLAQCFQIKERSLVKNFTLNNYFRSSQQVSKEWTVFSKRKDFNSIVSTYTQLQQELNTEDIQSWNSLMLYNWDQFTRSYPEKCVSDFTRQFGKINSFLQTSDLISHIIQSTTFDAKTFQLVYQHFAPLQSIPGKISSFLFAVFSRGWCVFGQGKRTVTLVQPHGFLFDNGKKQILLKNDIGCKFPGMWLIDDKDDGKRYEIESFFESHYPLEIPTNQHMIETIMKHFRYVEKDEVEISAE